MEQLFFLLIVLAFAIAAFIYRLKKKDACPSCGSNSIVRTGDKKYEESYDYIIDGSPSSFYEHEYKCNKCEHIFWLKQKTMIVS